MKYKAVIFDLDGTLLNTLEDLHDAVNYALEKFGLPLITLEQTRMFVGNGVEKLVERAIGENNKTLLPQVLACFKEYYSLHSKDKTRPYDGVTELVEKLISLNVKCAIVSNKFDGAVKSLAKEYFGEKFLAAVGESSLVRKKPAPDSVISVMKELNVSREEAIYIGDSDIDIKTAENSGLECISVLWGFRDKEFLIKNGGKIFAQTPDEVYNIIVNR